MKIHNPDFRPNRIISVGYESFEWFINCVIILSIALAAIEFMSAESRVLSAIGLYSMFNFGYFYIRNDYKINEK